MKRLNNSIRGRQEVVDELPQEQQNAISALEQLVENKMKGM